MEATRARAVRVAAEVSDYARRLKARVVDGDDEQTERMRMNIVALPADMLILLVANAKAFSAMCATCSTWANVLRDCDDSVLWKPFALSRFTRLAAILKSTSVIPAPSSWKALYREQLMAESLVPYPPAKPVCALGDFHITIEIRRGPRAAEDVGRIEISWTGTLEDGRHERIKLCTTEDARSLFFPPWRGFDGGLPPWRGFDGGLAEAVSDVDLKLHVWVTRAQAGGIRTIKLVDGSPINDWSFSYLCFGEDNEDSKLPEHGGDAGWKADLGVYAFICRAWVHLKANSDRDGHGVFLDDLIQGDSEEEYALLNADDVRRYLNDCLPWN